ncbi:MAG: diguanylate cyclase [Selenomonadaceae bacterium]|nr:diguanylate cyclase [Selenomonadaceae bacterium]
MLLLIMGALPFIIVTIVSARTMATQLEKSAEQDGQLRNSIVSEHMTELFEKNFNILHELALNPMIVQYLTSPETSDYRATINLLHDTNTILGDKNIAAMTASDTNQLMRTDGAKLVSLIGRQHFYEAMHGRDFISDIIVSRSTGRSIVVVEVPVKDRLNRPIGMVQRNLDLISLQQFIREQDTREISVIVMDREGKTIAHSDKHLDFEFEQSIDGRYKYIADRMSDSSGIFRTNVDGEDAIVSYSRNWLTDWAVVTVQPYHFIMEKVHDKFITLAVIGFFMLTCVFVTAYFLSERATKPIIEITNAADNIIKGGKNVEELEINSDDELGKMAAAFNKIRSSRDAYRLESELDKLTKLYNKSTTENIGKMKIKTFREQDSPETIMALYVIDLDHFKEANDNFGHQFGDKVLMEFARNLRKKFRPNDCIGRFGGDEFVVIIDNLPGMEIVTRKARDIKRVASELVIDGKNAGITASIGVAIVPQDGTDYDLVFKAADRALYHVKQNGRNGFYYAGAESIG